MLGYLAFSVVAFPIAAKAAVSTADVDRAIERGTQAILDTIQMFDTITWMPGAGRTTQTAIGRVERHRGGIIELRKTDGETVKIPEDKVKNWDKRGFVKQEMQSIHHGGPTALAALALLNAGVALNDERMDLLIDALGDNVLPEAGTYVRSVRAGVWSQLLSGHRISKEQRRKFKRLLHDDVQWLIREMRPNGAFDYGHDISVNSGDGDASNTQFANLGLWLGDQHGAEVGRTAWRKVENYWMDAQGPGGGWSYVAGGIKSSSSMTVAGCNSLYIVLERLYARSDKPYQLFTGCQPIPRNRKRVDEIFRAIHDGDSYLGLNPPNINQHQRYELFGIERLGLASGRAQIGGRDWFKDYADAVMSHTWGQEVIADSFTLIFLVHGQSPILIQKLAHGENESDWNYYFRDLHGLMRYLSLSFERLYRWQYVPRDADLHKLQNAPILLISGHGAFELPKSTRERLKEYVERGGTIMIHADRRNRRFAKDARRVVEEIFQSRRWRFQRLPEDHALFTCLHALNERRRDIPLEAMTDGPRIAVLLCPVDLAGAWHQQKENFLDVFRIMANLRVYSAPENDALPRVLRPRESTAPTLRKRGMLSIHRFVYGGDWTAHLGIWNRRATQIERETGIAIESDESDQPLDAEALASFDIVHLTTRGNGHLNDNDVERLTAYVKKGGLVVIESADGQADGNLAALKLVGQLTVGTRRNLMAEDAFAKGEFDGGAPLTDLVTTRAGGTLLRPGSAPPMILRELDNRIGVIACPFDLSSGLERHHIWQRIGFDGPSTDKIVYNILNMRLAEKAGRNNAQP